MKKPLENAARAAAQGALVLAMAIPAAISAPAAKEAPLPATLSATGLFASGNPSALRAGLVEFAPQYPLWSDGTSKRRWIALPPGTAIDASTPDAWRFPAGTKLWKEFRYGARVETRYIERTAAGWRYATYVWNAAGTEATLAPEDGAVLARADAPAGRYEVPSRSDCRVCHEGAAVPVLGFTALQLSPDRDPLAAHAGAGLEDLRSLTAKGLLRGLPQALLERPPRIEAATPTARAALGYLHGNCGHCHNAAALDGVEMRLAQGTATSASETLAPLLGRLARYRATGAGATARVAPGAPHASLLVQRMRAEDPRVRMPPLGTQRIDAEGLALVERWIRDLPPTLETSP